MKKRKKYIYTKYIWFGLRNSFDAPRRLPRSPGSVLRSRVVSLRNMFFQPRISLCGCCARSINVALNASELRSVLLIRIRNRSNHSSYLYSKLAVIFKPLSANISYVSFFSLKKNEKYYCIFYFIFLWTLKILN